MFCALCAAAVATCVTYVICANVTLTFCNKFCICCAVTTVLFACNAIAFCACASVNVCILLYIFTACALLLVQCIYYSAVYCVCVLLYITLQCVVFMLCTIVVRVLIKKHCKHSETIILLLFYTVRRYLAALCTHCKHSEGNYVILYLAITHIVLLGFLFFEARVTQSEIYITYLACDFNSCPK